ETSDTTAPPTLSEFVATALPRSEPDSSRRHAYLNAYARSPGWTSALVRAQLALGGDVPHPVLQMLDPALELDGARRHPSLTEWARVLNDYRRRLKTFDGEAALHRRELVDEALKRLGYGERKSRRLHTRLRPTTFGSALFSGVTEVLRHEHSGRDKVRSVVLVDEVRGHGRRLGSLRMARTLVDAGFDAMAVL